MSVSGFHSIVKEPFRVGVSYWPNRSGRDLWKQFDVDEVHEDFSVMSEVGINLARIVLPWKQFQPAPDTVHCASLAHLLELCDAAASEGVRLELLLFGSSTSSNDLPDWLAEDGSGGSCRSADGGFDLVSHFRSPVAKQAAATLARSIARATGGHCALWAYNLGDRPDRSVPHCCRVTANAWFDDLRRVIRDVDGRHPVTCSLSGANLVSSDCLRVDQVFSVLDQATIDRAGLHDSLQSSDLKSEAAFSCALTMALSGKSCLLQECGLSLETDPAGTNAQAQVDATRAMLEGLNSVGALGVVLGSFADLSDANGSENAGCAPGLVGASGQLRPHAEAIHQFTVTKPFVQKAPQHSVRIRISLDEFYQHPAAHVRRLYDEFLSS